METTQVGKRYAKAIFSLAEEQGVVDALAEDVQQLAQLFEASGDFEAFCCNPLIDDAERKQVFSQLFGNSAQPLTLQCLEFLGRKDRLGSLGAVCAGFLSLYREAKGILLAEITFSHPPTDGQVDALKQKLSAQTGKTIEAETKVDASLIGGFRVNIANEISDYSVATQLEQFKQQVLNA